MNISTRPMDAETRETIRRRTETIAALRARDGDMCAYPGANHTLDFDEIDGPSMVTIDHWIPVWYGRSIGRPEDEIQSLNNLRLMCKRHNARKGERIPNDDGTLPERPQKKFRYRRDKRAQRPEMCTQCFNGSNLAVDEICAACGSTGKSMPMWAKVRYQDCDHALLWCWVCSITPDMRPAAVDTAVLQSESGEWDAE